MSTPSLGSIVSGVQLGPDQDIFTYLRNNEVGNSTSLMGPFGPRRISYMDFTASGRALGFVEDYIRDVVAPLCELLVLVILASWVLVKHVNM